MEAHLTSGSRAPRRALPLHLGPVGDERLARLVAAGSERAFAALYERYHQQLYRYCRSILRSDADAQDALQSTLAAALAALQRGQRNAPLRPWLFRIAHNETISLLRRRRPALELSEREEPAAVGSTEERVDVRERLAQLVCDLQGLPERQRGALVMRELSGLSHEEIAIALGTSAGAAKQAIFDARQGLADQAEGRAMACEDVRRAISDGDRRVLRARRLRAHLRDCEGCAGFAAAIPARSSELRALAPPLAPVAAAGLLAQLTGAGTAHGGGGLGAVATAGAGKTVGATLAVKAAVGVAVIAAATAGVANVLPRATHGRPATATSIRSATPGAAGPSGARSRSAAGASGAAAGVRHPPRGASHGGGAAGAVRGAGVGGIGSTLTPPSSGLARGAHGGASQREHAGRARSGEGARRTRRGSSGARRSGERSSGTAKKAPNTSGEAKRRRPALAGGDPSASALAPPSAAQTSPQGSELTTRK
jgi:RNA polymerase sigma factor (sigma-70 family)